MADFSTPFSATGPRRNPNASEKANGFPCGPADQTLFNGMFHRIEAELGDLIGYAGLAGSDSNHTLVRQAVLALIDAATGGGEAENYLLVTQARARLPIHFEVLTDDGRMNFTSPASGKVRMPGGITFMHRGIFPVTTVQTDFDTLSSRTYHLRWNPTDGFVLANVADNTYNPDGFPETHVRFDSTYDDMLLARIITNSSNIPTITPLANKQRMRGSINRPMGGIRYDVSAPNAVPYTTQHPGINWARTPDISLIGYDSHINSSQQAVEKISLSTNRYVATIATSAYDVAVVGNGTPNFIEVGIDALVVA